MTSKIFKCNDCGKTGEFSSKKQARSANWAISSDCKKHYCPQCATSRRNVGCKGGKLQTTSQLKGQISLFN